MGRGSSGIARGGGGGGSVPKNPIDLTDKQAKELKERYESGFDDATKKSIEKYISREDFDGEGHSLSQVMNHMINQGIDLDTATTDEIYEKTGVRLTRTQLTALQRTNANIDAAMHPIGQDVYLQRGCHEGDLQRLFGISDYTSMTEKQLQDRLVGGTFRNPAVMSTSYNVDVNPFLGGGRVSGGREIVYNIKAAAGTPMVFGAMHQAEVVLGKGINWRVTGVHFTGKTARPRSTFKEMPQLQIDIETY